MVEIARSCVQPDYRTGATIALLWSGLAQYMIHRGYDYLIGCASISMADGGHAAASMYSRLGDSMSPLEYRVFPRHRLLPREDAAAAPAASARIPTLLKGYLRLGAWIGGEPAWDPDFNSADLFVLLPLARLEGRYARHYGGSN